MSASLAADDLVWRGYLSQSYVIQSDDNRVVRDDWGRQEAGVLASYNINGNADLRGMASIIGGDDSQPRLNFAMIDLHTDQDRLGVRLGRVNHVLGFYNEPRNFPFSRKWEFPPQGIYRDGFHYLARSGDGAQFYARYDRGGVSLDAELTFARPHLYPMPSIVEGHLLMPVGNFAEGSRVRGVNLGLKAHDLGTYLRYDQTLLDFEHAQFGGFETYVHYIGARQQIGPRNALTAEYIMVDKHGPGWTAATGLPKAPNSSGYSVTWDHDFNDTWSASLGYDAFQIDNGDPTCKNTLPGIPAHRGCHRSVNVAAIYRCAPWTVRAEWHAVKGSNVLPSVLNNLAASRERWQYGVVTVVYEF